MDKEGLASNLSDDGTSSNVSSISGLTGYEDEIGEIRNLIQLSNQQPTKSLRTQKHHIDSFSYQVRISNLNAELQNILSLNERYKNELFNLQRQHELQHHKKFEELLRKSTLLEVQLQNASSHIETIKNSKNTDAVLDFEGRMFQLENRNYELETWTCSLLSETEAAKSEIKSLQDNIGSLKGQLTAAQDDINIKYNCAEELKKKIADQHYNLQEWKRKDLETKNDLTSISNELQSSTQSVFWYKQRLNDCRNDRNKVSEQLLSEKTQVANKDCKIAVLQADIINWEYKYRELLVTNERDKNHLSDIIYMLKNEVACKETTIIPLHDDEEICGIRNLYEREITDLSNEMLKLKATMVDHGLVYEKIMRENAELLSRNITLQKSQNDKELRLQILEDVKTDLSDELNDIKRLLTIRENDVLKLNAESCKIKSALDSTLCEKEEITQATLVIRCDFQRFLNLHNQMKLELEERTKSMLDVQKCKQELFMQHNWNVCELEEYKHKEKEYLNKIGRLSREKFEIMQELAKANEELLLLKKAMPKMENENINIKLQNRELCEKSGFLQKDIDRLKEFVEDSEHKITFYKNSMNALNIELKSSENIFKERYKKLEEEKNHYRITFSNILECLCQKFAGLIQNDSLDIKSIKDSYRNNNLSIKDSPLDEILNKLDNYLLQVNNFVNTRTEEVSNTKLEANVGAKVKFNCKLKLYEKLKTIEERVFTLNEKFVETEKNFQKLPINSVDCNIVNADLQQLQAMIVVKDLEMQEKQKRYEVNNRTLLRKIKEHMRGRNSVEKHCKYLEDLYNNTIESLNNIKLELSQKDFEHESLRQSIQTKDQAVKKLQNTVANLEVQIAEEQECPGCFDAATLRTTINDLHMKLINENNKIDIYVNDVRAKEMSILSLKKQLNETHHKIDNQLMEHSGCTEIRKQLEEECSNEKIKHEETQRVLQDMRLKFDNLIVKFNNSCTERSKFYLDVQVMGMELNGLRENATYYMKEIETLNYSLHQKDEEIVSLKSQRTKVDNQNSHRECRLQNLLAKSEQDMKDMQDTLKLVNSEKYFLQRLSNDLKIALNITTKQNVALKEKLGSRTRDTEYHSLPQFVSNLPGPTTFDDARINKLLKVTDNLDKCKPLTNLHDCLNSLKKEMAMLQQQIAEKKCAASSL